MAEAMWIASIARSIEIADYDKAALYVHELTSDTLLDIRANLEFCLDMVMQEQRNRDNGYRPH